MLLLRRREVVVRAVPLGVGNEGRGIEVDLVFVRAAVLWIAPLLVVGVGGVVGEVGAAGEHGVEKRPVRVLSFVELLDRAFGDDLRAQVVGEGL